MKDNKISLTVATSALLTGLKWKTKRAVAKNTIGADISPVLTKNPLLNWPRNFNCVCGSGIKFKKCCLNGLSRQVTIEDAKRINEKLEKHKA